MPQGSEVWCEVFVILSGLKHLFAAFREIYLIILDAMQDIVWCLMFYYYELHNFPFSLTRVMDRLPCAVVKFELQTYIVKSGFMSKIPRRGQPTVTQSVAINKTKTPPLNPREKSEGGIRKSQRPKPPEPRTSPRQPESRQSPAPRPKPGQPEPQPRKVAPSPKLAKAKADAAAKANADAFEESERIRKEMQSEFGSSTSEKDAKVEWMGKFEAMQKELNDNFKEESAIDTNVMTTFNEAAKKVTPTNDVFKTTSKMMDAGFDALHEKMAREKELLQKRMELMRAMTAEMMSHDVDDCTEDLDQDNDLDDEGPASPKS